MLVPTAAALKAGVGYPIARTNYKGQQQTERKVITKQEQVCYSGRFNNKIFIIYGFKICFFSYQNLFESPRVFISNFIH